MSNLKKYEFWFVKGSQHLYGEEKMTRGMTRGRGC